MQQFFRFCAAADIEPEFDSYDALTAFCQWYVAGVGDKKLRAHTTLGSYLSAFADHCTEHDLPFAFADTSLRRRVNRFIQGLQNLFPHEPRSTVALCLDKLGHIAADYGFRMVADLYRRPIQWLSRWARVISAHDGFMRLGVQAAATAGVIALSARWAARERLVCQYLRHVRHRNGAV